MKTEDPTAKRGDGNEPPAGDSALAFLKALAPTKGELRKGAAPEGVTTEAVAQEVQEKPIEHEEPLTPEERKRQDVINHFRNGLEYVLGVLQARLPASATLGDIRKKLDFSEVAGYDQFDSQIGANEREAIIQGVLEKYAPPGGTVKSLFEAATVNGNMLEVYWDERSSGSCYRIKAPDVDSVENVNEVAIHNVSGIAEMVFDHTVKAGKAKPDLDGKGLLDEAYKYVAQIMNGEGMERENARSINEIREAMEERLENLRMWGEGVAKSFGTDIPDRLRKGAEAKRVAIINIWKIKIKEIQETDKNDKEIQRLHGELDKI